jgi:hypothetical protein
MDGEASPIKNPGDGPGFRAKRLGYFFSTFTLSTKMIESNVRFSALLVKLVITAPSG